MKILFIGCVKSSYVFLKALVNNNIDVVGVVTKEKSNFNSDFEDITPICEDNKIPYIYVENINCEGTRQFIKNIKPDIGYCLGWSQLIEDTIIDMFPKGMIGYHPAELPNNRGRHPIIWALALGLEETASTFFRMEKTADTGEILSQEKVDISYEDNANTLMDKLLEHGCHQIVKLTYELQNNNIHGVSQKGKLGNSWRKRGKTDGQIDWRMSSRAIYNLVRALTKPYVGAHFVFNDQEIKVWKVRERLDRKKTYSNIEPGKIIYIKERTFVVKSGDNLIEVLECDAVNVKVGDYL